VPAPATPAESDDLLLLFICFSFIISNQIFILEIQPLIFVESAAEYVLGQSGCLPFEIHEGIQSVLLKLNFQNFLKI
jgi:hypothetical protein